MELNWKVRIKNHNFWIAIIPALLLVIQAVGELFGLHIDLGEVGNKLLDIVNAVFLVLSILGIVNDPTTAGLKDSELAMTYLEPKRRD